MKWEFNYSQPGKAEIAEKIEQAIKDKQTFGLKSRKNLVLFNPVTLESTYVGRNAKMSYSNLRAMTLDISMHLLLNVEFVERKKLIAMTGGER